MNSSYAGCSLAFKKKQKNGKKITTLDPEIQMFKTKLTLSEECPHVSDLCWGDNELRDTRKVQRVREFTFSVISRSSEYN